MNDIFFMGISTKADTDGYIDLDLIYADFVADGFAGVRDTPSAFINDSSVKSYLEERQGISDDSSIGSAFIKPPLKINGGVYYAIPVLAKCYVYWLDANGNAECVKHSHEAAKETKAVMQ